MSTVHFYARNFLIEGDYWLQIRNKQIPIYENYPIVSTRPPTEKVLFRDIPFHVSDEDLLEYIYSQHNIISLTAPTYIPH